MKVPEIFENLEYGPAPEDANLAQEWLEGHGRQMQQFIGGEWVTSSSDFASYNPSTGKEIARIAQGSQEDVDRAVKSARRALPAWQALSGHERAKVLYALSRQIQRHSRLLSVVESLDNGKPIRETRDLDIPLVARHFLHHAGWAQIRDQEFPNHEPVGVCGQIIPWNFPLLMLAWKIAPALAMGNTVVLKPAEFTSLSALLFAEICKAAEVPAGVVNIVTGNGLTGQALVEHPDVDKIAFTGSTEVGRIIRTATAGSGKKVSLELGGKSPFIVFEDADLDAAVEGLVDAIWFNQGQVCCAGSRLLVQEGVAEKVIAKTKARMDKLRVGNPLDKAVDIGAIVDKVQIERIDGLVQQGKVEGADCYQPNWSCPKDGWFFPPTLLTNVDPASTVAQVEIFGPVLVAMTFRTPAEAVALANNTVFGLAASIWTENINLAHDVAARVLAGSVWVNCTNQFDASSGFGGYRESGFGREGGKEGAFEYLKPKELFKGSQATLSVPAAKESNGGIDRTHKLYIGGKQVRPDGGYSLTYETPRGSVDVGRGNRKDIRNAVEAADNALKPWSEQTAHLRAQILYYLAENLASERHTMLDALLVGGSENPERELDVSIQRLFHYAAWADKYDGAVHHVPKRAVVYTRHEAIGPVGVVCPDEAPLLGMISLVAPLIAMGNSVVCIPSEANPLPACELYRILEASDVPGGVWNIVTGLRSELVKTVAEHDTLQAVWHFGDVAEGTAVEALSAGNLKQTWCSLGKAVDWYAETSFEYLRRSVQVKNVWIPYGA